MGAEMRPFPYIGGSMVKYNFLKGNESDFPHIDNVNTYKYDNDFDYGRFDAPQMELTLCTVPWDMGEAHIGNRTISGIGNVVYFETREKRDAWFDAIPDDECYRFTTKFKELHRSLEIDVPIPYDMCAKHNYLRVKYAKFANDDSPVMYEGENGLREWFWFVREVEFLAPNTTRLHLLDDAFQTWIYDINVSGMVLERGHAPMFATRADDYLANPLENNEYLLTDDVNNGITSQVKSIDSFVFNDSDMYACIATTANPTGSWGSKSGNTWKVPARSFYNTQGQPSVYTFAIATENITKFFSSIDAYYPQFKQTVQCIFLASSKLLTFSNPFIFAETQCFPVTATRKTFDLSRLEKDMFGYDVKYADIAKLYTEPYAHIEVTDENGNTDIIKIEDTTGKIEISACISIAYPFITIDAHLLNTGGNIRSRVSYKNLSSRAMTVGGKWYDTLRTWQVPTFAVVLDPAKEYDYSSHFDRRQAVTDYTAAKNNANASANTITANAALATAANSAITARSNTSANTSASITTTHNTAQASINNTAIAGSADSTIAANEMQGTVGAVSSAITGATSAITSAATGNIGGAVSGIVSGIVGAGSTMANMTIANGLTASQAAIQQNTNTQNSYSANSKTLNDASNQTGTASDITSYQNTQISGQAANTAATQIANASRTASAAQSAINNGIAQAALNAPSVFGSFANGDSSSTKPMGLFAQIVTQSKGAIRATGDEFLRYGYMFDGQWEFNGNWNVGKYFTYWKLKDFWVSNLNVPDMYMDKIRFFLFGGVTIWRKPEYIGHVSVYDNFNE